MNKPASVREQIDAVVVGAGFSGLYMLYRLRQLGLSVKAYARVPVRLAWARGHTHTSVTMVGVVISGAPVRAEIGAALRNFFAVRQTTEQIE